MFRVDAMRAVPENLPTRAVPQYLHRVTRRIYVKEGYVYGLLDWPSIQRAMSNFSDSIEQGFALFTEASGDFQMMHRSLWWKIRGYFEWPTYAHFDSIMQQIAWFEKVPIRVLRPPMYIYHQFHSSGGFAKRSGKFDVTDFEALRNRGNPNNCSWGAPSISFPEERITLSTFKRRAIKDEEKPWWYPF